MLAIRKILCPTDFSEPAGLALNHAAELAAHFGAELYLVNVVPVLPALPNDPGYVFNAEEFQRALDASAKRELERLAAKLRDRSPRIHVLLEHGDPGEEIARIAGREHADLIVMSTHGRSGVQHLLLGSVAEKVIRIAPCAVLIVRPQVPSK